MAKASATPLYKLRGLKPQALERVYKSASFSTLSVLIIANSLLGYDIRDVRSFLLYPYFPLLVLHRPLRVLLTPRPSFVLSIFDRQLHTRMSLNFSESLADKRDKGTQAIVYYSGKPNPNYVPRIRHEEGDAQEIIFYPEKHKPFVPRIGNPPPPGSKRLQVKQSGPLLHPLPERYWRPLPKLPQPTQPQQPPSQPMREGYPRPLPKLPQHAQKSEPDMRRQYRPLPPLPQGAQQANSTMVDFENFPDHRPGNELKRRKARRGGRPWALLGLL